MVHHNIPIISRRLIFVQFIWWAHFRPFFFGLGGGLGGGGAYNKKFYDILKLFSLSLVSKTHLCQPF